MARRQEAELGIISLIGAMSCAVISSELYADLAEGKAHFPLPRLCKAILLPAFLLFVILETNKVRRRFGRVIDVA